MRMKKLEKIETLKMKRARKKPHEEKTRERVEDGRKFLSPHKPY
jgi:hypothetical protein